MVGFAGIRSDRCVYGDPRGERTVILFGDSHALQYFPALQEIARRNRWRLLVWTKRECTPAAVTIRGEGGRPYIRCDAWRRGTLQRIEAGGEGATVVLSGESKATAYRHGKTLSGRADAKALQAGYAATLRRIQGAGAAVVVIRDTPEAPQNVADCVAAHIADPAACDFRRPRRWNRDFDVRAARAVPGTVLVDLSAAICPGERCRAVISKVLVYRDEAHLTATYARALAPRLEPPLKRAVTR